jgi:MoxR-like ATPase
MSSSRGSILDFLKILGVIGATGGLLYVFDLISGVSIRPREKIKVIHHSVTPNEMRDIIKDLYSGYTKEYFDTVRWVNCVDEGGKLVKCTEDEDKNLTEKVVKIVAEVLTRRRPMLKPEEAEDEARNIVTPGMPRMKRVEVMMDYVESYFGYMPSLLFVGEPGVGKSETARSVAMSLAGDLGLEFLDFTGINTLRRVVEKPYGYFVYVDLRLTSMEPADITGIPRSLAVLTRRERGGRASELLEELRRILGSARASDYVPFAWALVLKLTPGILNLEELSNVQREDMMSAVYQLALDKRAGELFFSKGTLVIALGNPRGWSSIARQLPTPLLNRFLAFEVAPPSIEDWINYMNKVYGDKYYTGVADFLRAFPEYFTARPGREERGGQEQEVTATGVIFARPEGLTPNDQIPTPRSWTNLAVSIYRMFNLGNEGDRKTFTDCLSKLGDAYMQNQFNTEDLGEPPSSLAESPRRAAYEALTRLNRCYDIGRRLYELARAAVGTAAGDMFVTAMLVMHYLPSIDKLMKSKPEDIRKQLDELWSRVSEKIGDKAKGAKVRASRLLEFWARELAVSLTTWLDTFVYTKEGATAEEYVPQIAAIIDWFGDKGVSPEVLRIFGTGLHKHTDLKAKMKLYETSKYVKQDVDQYMENLPKMTGGS